MNIRHELAKLLVELRKNKKSVWPWTSSGMINAMRSVHEKEIDSTYGNYSVQYALDICESAGVDPSEACIYFRMENDPYDDFTHEYSYITHYPPEPDDVYYERIKEIYDDWQKRLAIENNPEYTEYLRLRQLYGE